MQHPPAGIRTDEDGLIAAVAAGPRLLLLQLAGDVQPGDIGSAREQQVLPLSGGDGAALPGHGLIAAATADDFDNAFLLQTHTAPGIADEERALATIAVPAGEHPAADRERLAHVPRMMPDLRPLEAAGEIEQPGFPGRVVYPAVMVIARAVVEDGTSAFVGRPVADRPESCNLFLARPGAVLDARSLSGKRSCQHGRHDGIGCHGQYGFQGCLERCRPRGTQDRSCCHRACCRRYS